MELLKDYFFKINLECTRARTHGGTSCGTLIGIGGGIPRNVLGEISLKISRLLDVISKNIPGESPGGNL